MAYPNSPGGGKRRSTSSRKFSKKITNEDDDDLESQASETTPTNSCGFMAYSNSGEKPWVKAKTLNQLHQQPIYSNASRQDRSVSLSLFPTPSPSPSPRKLRCLDPREIPSEEKHEHNSKKRRAREVNPSSPLDLLWQG